MTSPSTVRTTRTTFFISPMTFPIASAGFIFIANLTYTQRNGECDLRPSKTWVLLVGENADRVADSFDASSTLS
ncbi:hypothetical protein EDB86DRAFT_2991464 [Lactarius hatsudake]|nr:hypothetical protein EDB86DRAFT_2991464 [Lactarius hatsudake]